MTTPIAPSHLLDALLDARPSTRHLDPARRAQLVRSAEILEFGEPGALVFAEGDPADGLYVLLDGEARVERAGPSGQPHVLDTIRAGALFGEAALEGGGRRSAAVRMASGGRVARFDIARLAAESADDPGWLQPILLDITRENLRRVEVSSGQMLDAWEREAAETRRRLAMGHFLLWIVGGLCLYTLTLSVAASVTHNLLLSSIATNGVIALAAFGMYRLVRASPYPRSTFGLVINPGWRREIVEALGVTAALMGAVTVLKWALINTVDRYADLPLFDSPLFGTRPMTAVWLWTTLIYFPLAAVQELVARGTLQGLLTEFLGGARSHIAAILLANLIFATHHAHLSLFFAAMSFAPGLVWGALYHRQRSLIGVSLCHALVGIYALHLMGMGVMARL